MTEAFDKKARDKEKSQMKLFNNLKADGSEKARDMVVKAVSAGFVRQYVASYHYSKIMPDNAFNCFAGFYGNKLAGVVVFGNGANNQAFSALIPDFRVMILN